MSSNRRGFGTPGADCQLPGVYGMLEQMYQGDDDDVAEFGLRDGQSIVSQLEAEFGSLESLSEEEIYGLFEKLRAKWKIRRISKLLGKIKMLRERGRQDKAKKRALRLAKVVNKLKGIDPSYEPTDEVLAYMAWANGDIDDPDEYKKESEQPATGAGIFSQARAYNTVAPTAMMPGVRPYPVAPPLMQGSYQQPYLPPPPMRGRGGRGPAPGAQYMSPMRPTMLPVGRTQFRTPRPSFGGLLGIGSFEAPMRGGMGITAEDLYDDVDAIATFGGLSRLGLFDEEAYGGIQRADLFGGLDDESLDEEEYGDVDGPILTEEELYGAIHRTDLFGGLDDEEYGGAFTALRRSLDRRIAAAKSSYERARLKGDIKGMEHAKSIYDRLVADKARAESMPTLHSTFTSSDGVEGELPPDDEDVSGPSGLGGWLNPFAAS